MHSHQEADGIGAACEASRHACETAFLCCLAQLILLTRGRASSPKSGYCTGCGLILLRGMKVTRPAFSAVSSAVILVATSSLSTTT